MQALILAAGKGTRMRSKLPKVMHEIFGKPMLVYVIETLSQAGIKNPKIVLGSGAEQVRSFLSQSGIAGKKPDIVLQREQKGTGHAVMMAERALGKSKSDLLIWPGDMPLIKHVTIENFIREHRDSGSVASALSSIQGNPEGYGRILRAGRKFCGIREELDASESEKEIREVNSGVYIFKTDYLFLALGRIQPTNAKQEFYLTDTIEILSREGCPIEAFPLASASEAQGINSREDLAMVIKEIKKTEIERHQERGVTFMAPDQTFVAPGVKIGQDTTIYPWTYIESNVRIGADCQIGPFAKIRSGSQIGKGAVIGSFVEINRSKIGNKVLAKHLTYLGDAVIGDQTNVGAGTITANYDGVRKHLTRIGKKVLVGSDTVFVAPVTVGDGAKTGAGAVVTSGSKIKKGEVVVGVPARLLHKSKRKK